MKTAVCAVFSVCAACGGASAWAVDGANDQPALRLPGDADTAGWLHAPQQALRHWASDLSDRVARIGRPHLPTLRWRAETAIRYSGGLLEQPIALERSRTALTAHWQPLQVGAWKVGAAMGVSRALPSAPRSGTTGFAAMPMASYEQARYRVNLGLVAPRGKSDPTLVVGLTIPLH